MPYYGWSEDWIDDRGFAKVSESFIKSFVYRYFELPEDYDEDDKPLIMIFVRCRLCDCIYQHYTTETEEDVGNYVYNWDNTYTALNQIQCGKCGLIWNHNLERFWCLDIDEINAIYRRINPQFDSPLEEYFWESWKTKCRIALIPQYKIGRYRVDFAHIPTRTVIELDGKQYHSTPNQIMNDKLRQAELEKQGWRFIRLEGKDVQYYIDECIVNILNFLAT